MFGAAALRAVAEQLEHRYAKKDGLVDVAALIAQLKVQSLPPRKRRSRR